jgi:uncharacterized membrane protein
LEKRLWTRQDHVVRGVWFAVGAEGAEGVVVLLAVVLIGTVPWIDADDAGQIFRAEVIDQDGFLVGDDEVTAVAAVVAEGFGDD